MRQALYGFSGFDLTTIDGIGVDTALVILSELGLDFTMFPDESHFVSLSPTGAKSLHQCREKGPEQV